MEDSMEDSMGGLMGFDITTILSRDGESHCTIMAPRISIDISHVFCTILLSLAFGGSKHELPCFGVYY